MPDSGDTALVETVRAAAHRLTGDAQDYDPLLELIGVLIVGGNDFQVIELNRAAFARLRCEKQLIIVPGATHLFEGPNALEEVARLARAWFETHLAPAQASDHTSENGPGGSVSGQGRVHPSRTK